MRTNGWACILLNMVIAGDEHTAQRGVPGITSMSAPSRRDEMECAHSMIN